LRSILLGARAVAVALVLVAALAACGGGSAGPLQVDSVAFMRDDAGKPGATVASFKPSDHVLHAEAKLNQMTTNFTGRVAWVAVDTAAGAGIPIAETNVSGLAANTISSKLELPTDWPVGNYRVDFFQGDTLLKSGEFTVQP
jgi:hypothetical protein